MKSYSIAVIPGDGVGPEVIREGQRAIEAAASGFRVEWVHYPYGASHYLKAGETLPDQAVGEISSLDAVFLGPIGSPRVRGEVLEKRILQKLYNCLGQFAGVMPVKLYPNISVPFSEISASEVDFFIVKENMEDFNVGIGGSFWKGAPGEIAVQAGVVSRKGCERVMEYTFGIAKGAKVKKVTSCDKADRMSHSYGLWRKVFCEVASKHKRIETEFALADELIPSLAKGPGEYGVILSPSLFGEIFFGFGAMLAGGNGMAFSADVAPGGVSSFKPFLGPEGKKGRANPMGTVLCGAMMLSHLGEKKTAEKIRRAVAEVLREGKARTQDIGGKSGTGKVGSAIMRKLV